MRGAPVAAQPSLRGIHPPSSPQSSASSASFQPPARYFPYHSRSEEHTSELQSLRHLVCGPTPFPYTTLFRSVRIGPLHLRHGAREVDWLFRVELRGKCVVRP